jgi:hypothetical protein
MSNTISADAKPHALINPSALRSTSRPIPNSSAQRYITNLLHDLLTLSRKDIIHIR